MPDRDRGTRRTRALLLLGGLFVAAVAYLLIVTYTGRGIPCFIHRTTGLLCGSCGLTRAFSALLQGDLSLAFSHHPLWPLYVAWAVWVAVSDTLVYVRRGKIQCLPRPLWVHASFAAVVTLYGILRNL